MKAFCLFCLLIGSQHAFAVTCDIERGYYEILVKDQLEVNIKACNGMGWGQFPLTGNALFEEEDLFRAKRELLTKHRPMIQDRCQLHGTGDIEIVTQSSSCSQNTTIAIANFAVQYKCHLY